MCFFYLRVFKTLNEVASSSFCRRKHLPTYNCASDLWDLKASDYRYLSQMLIFALGTGKDTYFEASFTVKLRNVLLKMRTIGKMLWHPGAWSEARLSQLQEVLKTFGAEFKDVFRDVAAGKKEDDKCGFIKLHALMHIVEDIRRYGSPFNYSLESWERSHQEFVKRVFMRTNASKDGVSTEENMLKELVRREIIYQAMRISEIFDFDDLKKEEKDVKTKKKVTESVCVVPWKTHQVVVPPVVHFELSTAISFAYHFQGFFERVHKTCTCFFSILNAFLSIGTRYTCLFFRNQRSKYTSLQRVFTCWACICES